MKKSESTSKSTSKKDILPPHLRTKDPALRELITKAYKYGLKKGADDKAHKLYTDEKYFRDEALTRLRAEKDAQYTADREAAHKSAELQRAQAKLDVALAAAIDIKGLEIIDEALQVIQASGHFMVLYPPGIELRIFRDSTGPSGFGVMLVATVQDPQDNSFRMGIAGRAETPRAALEALKQHVQRLSKLLDTQRGTKKPWEM